MIKHVELLKAITEFKVANGLRKKDKIYIERKQGSTDIGNGITRYETNFKNVFLYDCLYGGNNPEHLISLWDDKNHPSYNEYAIIIERKSELNGLFTGDGIDSGFGMKSSLFTCECRIWVSHTVIRNHFTTTWESFIVPKFQDKIRCSEYKKHSFLTSSEIFARCLYEHYGINDVYTKGFLNAKKGIELTHEEVFNLLDNVPPQYVNGAMKVYSLGFEDGKVNDMVHYTTSIKGINL